MRFLHVDTIYPPFAEELYARTPALREAPYETQIRTLWDACFGVADAYPRHLAEIGHETAGVVMNCPSLQAAWLAEHRGLRHVARRLLERPAKRPDPLLAQVVLLAQVERFRPDVVFIHDLWQVSDRFLDVLRRRVPYLVAQIASHPPPIGRIRRFDLVLSSFPHFVQWFRDNGIDAELFRLAYYERVGELLEREGVPVAADAPNRAGVVLVGGLSPRVYPTVTPAIERLCAEVDLDVWGYGIDDLPADSAIRARFRGPAWGLEMYRHYARARVVVNRHGDIAGGVANNMRMFEATGMGAVLVTEAAPNLRSMFEPDAEVVTYADGHELVERVQGLLDDDARATDLATAGQTRTLRDHTYRVRMRELSELLEERFASGRARSAIARS